MERGLLLLVAATLMAVVTADGGHTCSGDKLTIYKVVVSTFWTRDTFPKHYPDWRPPAQWSKTIGRTHDSSFSLFELGKKASPGVRMFAETGRSELLDAQSQGARGVYDEFAAPPITKGAGTVEAKFFLDGNHSKVSLMTRIVPSPDWFIGVDSFDLCNDGKWIDTLTLELDPIDAGTDNGFTFTAPNWATEPAGVVFRITNTYPAHPAGSFHYPFLKRLPAIAFFQFVKLREYELAQEFDGKNPDKSHYEVIKISELPTVDRGNDVDEDVNKKVKAAVGNTDSIVAPPAIAKSVLHRAAVKSNSSLSAVSENNGIDDGNEVVVVHRHQSRRRMKKNMIGNLNNANAHKLRPPRDCRVSDWGSWEPCSRSCGIGETQRKRTVTKHARRGGSPCPPLTEAKWCGSARSCPKGYFNW
ncbi:spondin-2 [Neocloeon triangulifer]|uniref:spondin-2 n=1 Tax=Neocloeon triangulifer TaxID=2078957 RepID=UPI00286F5D8A|nr:spondin-2 [Neocloeon triangulifer]